MDPNVAFNVKPADPLGLVLGRYLLTGDEGAIEEVVAATRSRLLAAARRIAGRDDAEDAVQTAYLSLVRHRGAPLDAPVLPWLLTAVVRSAYRRRAASRHDQMLADRLAMAPDDGPDPADVGLSREDLARLRAAIARLPARYRDPVVLHDLHGLSTADVARLLDLSEAGVRTRLHRARALVRSRLAPRLFASILVLPFILAERARDVGLVAAIGVGGAVNIPTIGLIAVVALAAGVFIGPKIFTTDSTSAERAERAELKIRELDEQVKTLTLQLDDAKMKMAAATALAAAPKPRPIDSGATPPPSVPSPAMSDPAASAKPDASKRVAVAGYEELIEAVDWGKVGSSLKDMVPLMPRLLDEWTKSGKVPKELGTQIGVLNINLVQAALAAAGKLKIEPQLANSAYTHPTFMVNAMAAALESAGKPLSSEQMDALGKVAARDSADDVRRLAAYDDRVPALKKLLDETELKERFFDAAFAILRPDQRDTLVDPSIKGRMQLDLFSPGLLWAAHAQVVRFTDADDLAVNIENGTMNLLGWGEDKRSTIHGVAVEAVSGLPRDVMDELADGPSKLGMVPLARVVDGARRTMAMLERLIEVAHLDDAMVKAVHEVSHAMVPIKVAK